MDKNTEETKERSMEKLLHDVPLELSVELGRVTLSLRELSTRMSPGAVIAIGKQTGDRLDIRVNGRLVARGEAVTVGDRYGVRISEILGQEGGKL
jgi:flagellar motor switch protein FliN/FliY